MLLLVAALCAAPLVQAGTLDDIRKRGAMRLGYAESKAPFSFNAKDDGQPAGFSVELCKRVAAAAMRSLGVPSLP
ncbi:MAG: amino acid ABC transporter substrate-binding protein, partial [Rubrivivax sp.]|nr:amino acid ABC transporter substrate-binding protein [Rubrivivax sp.]